VFGLMNRAMADAEQVGGLLYGNWRRCTNSYILIALRDAPRGSLGLLRRRNVSREHGPL